ncbi:hypothetical protein JQ615_11830 [Bradyrhizobium jicamae]|uniref:Uncharacterized protein n=1 Tax=Bradyrhizobium jicamae TaxID=280332 RepID=A0ABS5FH17_9BRAD|nr:hypothetical protein [Bradyrhizobium jicamae]MBR0796079.1 hypothetical protein [Bradyrhizobium jicamae]
MIFPIARFSTSSIIVPIPHIVIGPDCRLPGFSFARLVIGRARGETASSAAARMQPTVPPACPCKQRVHCCVIEGPVTNGIWECSHGEMVMVHRGMTAGTLPGNGKDHAQTTRAEGP